MAKKSPETYSLASISLKAVLVHTVTYFVIGFISFSIFDYSARYADPMLGNYMRQTTHPLVAAGPMFQIFRGLLFGLVFFLLRDIYFKKNGWLSIWVTLLIVGIISTFGPSPSSFEGLLYTNVPIYFHLIGLPEVVVQSFLLAYLTHFWVIHPEKKWLSWLFGIAFGFVVIMSTMGILAALSILKVPA
ncbi:hypothetical protein hrd7_03730 [Leptolinea sp. HRD-7]|nr:hypothetical protein hrd7_03730 [Leptolinea sp. HRD-7]